jgi:hypothetical protein
MALPQLLFVTKIHLNAIMMMTVTTTSAVVSSNCLTLQPVEAATSVFPSGTTITTITVTNHNALEHMNCMTPQQLHFVQKIAGFMKTVTTVTVINPPGAFELYGPAAAFCVEDLQVS